MKYKAAIRKLKWEQFFMTPFVWMGFAAAKIWPLKTQHRLFLFFPNADIGGAVKVNADIAELFKAEKPLIIFSKKAHNNLYRPLFEATGIKIIDLHRQIDNKALHFINFFYRGLLAGWINAQPKATVFGGESIFFYKIIPHLRPSVKCVELCHVSKWLPYNIGFIHRIHARIFSTRGIKKEVEQQYRQNDLPQAYFQKLFFIDNAIDIPEVCINNPERLQLFFIGRGSPQKRIHLVAQIAHEAHEQNLPVDVNFVGDVEKMIDPGQYPYCRFYGSITDKEKMATLYRQADVLLLTSAFEGLPVVIMEMMALGKTVISTAVSGIPDYIFHRKNGLLIYALSEAEIIAEGIQLIKEILAQPSLLQQWGQQARQDAIAQFGRSSFNAAYQKIMGS